MGRVTEVSISSGERSGTGVSTCTCKLLMSGVTSKERCAADQMPKMTITAAIRMAADRYLTDRSMMARRICSKSPGFSERWVFAGSVIKNAKGRLCQSPLRPHNRRADRLNYGRLMTQKRPVFYFKLIPGFAIFRVWIE